MSSYPSVAQVPSGDFKMLGICWAAYGVLRLVAAVLLVVFSGTATVMFGTLLARVADPFTLMGIFHFMYAADVVASAIAGLFALLGGLALAIGGRAARLLVLIAAFLSLFHLPVGIILGVYTLIVMLPRTAAEMEYRLRRAA